jgi:hypothetical protein
MYSPRGSLVGIELVKVITNHPLRFGVEPCDFADALDTWIWVQQTISKKEEKRRRRYWQLADDTILVVQLFDLRSEWLIRQFDDETLAKVSSTGFSEIWIADYTIIEAFGTVQLIGIKPKVFSGLHAHRYSGTKPYG